MTLPRSAADVLSGHVVFELECIDRIYLLSGLAEGSSQFTGRARDEVDTFPGRDRVPGSGGSGSSSGRLAGADRRRVGAVATV